jgi:predicted aspartyl protease
VKGGSAVGTFSVSCEVVNVVHKKKTASLPKILVDSDSEFTRIPEDILKKIGIGIEKKDVPFLMANGQTITRATGYAILRVGEFETVDEVVFGQPGDLALLGARTLEGFGALVDPRTKKLVAAGPHPAATSQSWKRVLAAGVCNG